MKNSIFKSYSKKILKSEAFVSVIIVFVLAIGIISTSYALYMDVDKDTDYQLVQVGDLSIGFDKGDNTISLSNMTPTDDDIALKQTDNIFSFYIYNTGTYTADYNIKLVTTDGNEVDKQYINYKICKDNANNCEDIKTLSDVTDEIIYTDELSPKKSGDATNPSSYYFIRIWINNKYSDTTSKNIKLKVVIDATSGNTLLDNKNTLAGRILNDSRIKINNDTPDFKVAESEEKGLYKAPDDYGTTYYFRGKQSYNYVSFMGKIWQIVRINGDGSIRLAINSSIGTSFYNEETADNAYAGYMYGLTGVTTDEERCLKLNESNTVENIISTYTTKETCETNGGTWTTNGYEATHANLKNSTVKDFLDNWYSTNVVNKTNSKGELYTDYISDEIFCNDKTIYRGKGYGNNSTYYSGYTRISDGGWKSPTFICANETSNDLSRFTVEKQSLKNGNVTNGKLKYPIGLLSGDEVKFAGSIYSNYTKTISLNYLGWTMTPHYYVPDKYQLIYISEPQYPIWANSSNNGSKGVFPVLSLKKDVLIDGGNGTSSNPYTLKLY